MRPVEIKVSKVVIDTSGNTYHDNSKAITGLWKERTTSEGRSGGQRRRSVQKSNVSSARLTFCWEKGKRKM